MKTYDLVPNQLRVADFLGWMREGSLNLNPPFQRRAVWKPEARSYFVDTVYRGLPVPLVFIRERVDLATQRVSREVVDGQQRLRTLFAFIDETLLPDFNSTRDRFTVRRNHNSLLGGKPFKELDSETQSRILGYRFSIQVLPAEMEDREILQIFARLNSTGVKLNHQELRNAEYFGEFKTLMYELAYEQFERWLEWKLLTEEQLSRMVEVEITSDLILNMIRGLTGKSQARLNSAYKDYDLQFSGGTEYGRRFRRVMDAVEDLVGTWITNSVFNSEIHFFSLFVYLYDRMYGLGSEWKKRNPFPLPAGLQGRLRQLSQRFKSGEVPKEVQDAVARASSDYGRRKTRFDYYVLVCDAKASN